jgi:hypothetical protein
LLRKKEIPVSCNLDPKFILKTLSGAVFRNIISENAFQIALKKTLPGMILSVGAASNAI